jgi:asparagine synthase (glutamine-hydrolysing)
MPTLSPYQCSGMCGIVGIWRHDGGDADRSAIGSMLAPIAHRGPDGEGVWQKGRVAFGHRRLSIVDLTEASSQPMRTPDGAGVLAYNGEIYNHRELRRDLEREGVQFRSSGDTEVLLQALHHWGPDRCIARLNGMFAFAYLDTRDGTLWLARDKFGIKPLAVADTGTELIFASEAKALIAHPRMARRADRYALASWLLSTGRGLRRMLFEGIDDFDPGSLWKVTPSGIEKRKYFEPINAVDVDRLVAASREDPTQFVSGFRDRLQRSVTLHLLSDVPLAAMCSGGVDSSLVAACAKDQLPHIEGYVADVQWPSGEGDQAARVGRHLGIPIRRIVVDQARFLRLWPYTVWHSDAPSVQASDTALLAVVQACRADGVKVLLTGEGSDELFGGYPWQQKTYNFWRQLESWRHYFFPDRHLKKMLRVSPFSRVVVPNLNRLTVALESERTLLPQRLMERLAPIESGADRAFLARCLFSLNDHLSWILHRHDRIGMAASLEMRVPFLENEMIDFAFHLPRRAKLHQNTGKWLVKQAATEVLPADVVFARKKGFPFPIAYAFGTERLLSGGMLAEFMGWPAQTTEAIIAMLRGDGGLLLHVVGLELWFRLYFGGATPEALGETLMGLAEDAMQTLANMSPRKRKAEALG